MELFVRLMTFKLLALAQVIRGALFWNGYRANLLDAVENAISPLQIWGTSIYTATFFSLPFLLLFMQKNIKQLPCACHWVTPSTLSSEAG